jgi:hypothetical protein
MAKETAPRPVQCYHCKRRFEVGAQAMTIPCPACHQILTVNDVIVKTLQQVRKLQTCGRVVVQKRGAVKAELVVAQEGVEVEGVMEANVISGGPVRICAKALWKGDCRAPSLEVELGSTISSGYFVIPDDSLRAAAPPGGAALQKEGVTIRASMKPPAKAAAKAPAMEAAVKETAVKETAPPPKKPRSSAARPPPRGR